MLIFKLVILKLFLILNLVFINISFADNHNIYETLEIIKNDLKTLERAVYSGSIEVKASTNDSSVSNLDQNSEDVLTRHLLKLSEVEDQFRELTNKFEEINFKLDKLSTRVSKIQADNQIRFQDIETNISSGITSTKENKLSLKLKMNKSDSYDSKLSQARGLASQLGMFAEENDIPKDLWDSLEATIYDFYKVSHDR